MHSGGAIRRKVSFNLNINALRAELQVTFNLNINALRAEL